MTRVISYARVSTIRGRGGASFISPEVQREQVAAWALSRGHTVVAHLEDLDVSGGKLDRPKLNEALAMLERGEADVLAVARLDRLSRAGVGDALNLVERIHDLGGQVAAVDLGLDPTTPMGEFALTIMLALARMERRRISDQWAVAKSRAVDRGVAPARTPLGYMRDGGGFVPDPETAPIVQEAFRLAAADGLTAARAYLEQAQPEMIWNPRRVRALLSNRTYLGEARYGDLLNPEAHEPLVPRHIFAAAQAEPSEEVRRRARDFPLSGLPVECGTCGSRLVGGRAGQDGRRVYKCSAATPYKGQEKCPKPVVVTADRLEEWLVARMADDLRHLFADIPDEQVAMGATVQAAQDALDAAEAERREFAEDLRARRAMGDDLWHDTLDRHAAAVETAQEEFTRAAKASEARTLSFANRADEWTLEEAVSVLRQHRCAAAVFPGKGKRIEDRADLAWSPGPVRFVTELETNASE